MPRFAAIAVQAAIRDGWIITACWIWNALTAGTRSVAAAAVPDRPIIAPAGQKEIIAMDRLLNDGITKQVRDVFDAQLKQPVEMLFFGRKTDCETCGETRQLLEELAAISPKLSLSVYDVDENPAIAQQHQVDKFPGLVLAAKDDGSLVDYGIRFAGIPSGHEFSTLIHDLILVSERDSGLSAKTRDFLKTLTRPVHLQVFVTPT
jgi:glutaredoxin-like protein